MWHYTASRGCFPSSAGRTIDLSVRSSLADLVKLFNLLADPQTTPPQLRHLNLSSHLFNQDEDALEGLASTPGVLAQLETLTVVGWACGPAHFLRILEACGPRLTTLEHSPSGQGKRGEACEALCRFIADPALGFPWRHSLQTLRLSPACTKERASTTGPLDVSRALACLPSLRTFHVGLKLGDEMLVRLLRLVEDSRLPRLQDVDMQAWGVSVGGMLLLAARLKQEKARGAQGLAIPDFDSLTKKGYVGEALNGIVKA